FLKQFFKHVNPYTKLTYVDDPDVIAVEINNEPSHSGPKPGVTNYINRLAAAVRSTGCSKPIYYNISQGPFYADAVAKANIEGVSFQWYPSGLVANQEVMGNFLPHVDSYTIPFDTIPEYRTKTRMVYEFDAADILQSYMYPAMARSFRGAGFQWATQFAYDPLAIAYANTEYQTHYLNLAYTPSKAISFLIASKVFHRVPRLKQYGSYPADTLFDVFRVSYKSSLSEMNSDEEFYYSNTTSSNPVNIARLQHIAGVGSSPMIQYAGTGAYFLDRIEEGVWRLEVMPDAVHIRDPFERASPSKEVTDIQWRRNSMQINLPDLGNGFSIKGLNTGNQFSASVQDGKLQIEPGTYLLAKSGKNYSKADVKIGSIALNEFVSPPISSPSLYLRHEPFTEVTAGKPFIISATVVGIDTGKVSLQVSRLGGGFGPSRLIPMERTSAYEFRAEVPASLVVPGMLTYRIILQKGNDYAVFPENVRSNPFAWDNYSIKTYATFVAATNSKLELFNPTNDRNARIYPSFRRGFQSGYTVGTGPLQLVLRLSANELSGDHTMGVQYFFSHKVKGRMVELDSMSKLVISARTGEAEPVRAKITLTNSDAISFSAFITLTNSFQELGVPLNSLVADSSFLLPRPYPGFLALKFAGSNNGQKFRMSEAEKIEITIGFDASPADRKKPHSLELGSIWLQK
ncbi:MAG TPA: membrane or secreted protein, partial [Chitinophagaceae bacterium]|nr:membrane or secreted protein [Chitinophagaceae bacterium]